MATYTLPDLPYDYAALEPFISEKTMRYHHDKHHAAYVEGANAAQNGLAQARAAGDKTLMAQLMRNLAFNLAGHINHSIFWENLSPKGGGEPTGQLANAIADSFGSFDAFKQQFTTLATSIQGSGWAMLVLDHTSEGLQVLEAHDHQMGLPAKAMPLLVLDMWEHAYYLDHFNEKAKYVTSFWEVVNWDDVARRFAQAQ